MKNLSQRTLRRAVRRGFTLMEVILVLAILGVIAAMVVPQLIGRQRDANIKATRASIHGIEQAAELFAVDHDGNFPTTIDMLLVNTANNAKWKGPYLKGSSQLPADAWGNPLQYEYPGANHPNGDMADIYSFGPDMTAGTDDDINNWTPTM